MLAVPLAIRRKRPFSIVRAGAHLLAVALVAAAAGDARAELGEGPASLSVGHVTIAERGGQAVSVLIDGVDCGTTPWEGDLEAGPHRVAGGNASVVAGVRSVTVVAGAPLAIELAAVPRTANVLVATDDPLADIAVDAQLVGRGAFRGPLPIGTHALHVERAGFEPYDRSMVLREGQTWSDSVRLVALPVPRPQETRDRAASGVYAGLLTHALFEPGGASSDICSAPGVSDCSISDPVGGGILGYLGYTTRPIGVDLLLGFQLDTSQANGSINGVQQAVTIPRIGGLLAIRARWVIETQSARFSAGLGVGGALRSVGTPGGGPASVSYLAPAVTAEAAAHLPITASIAVSLGLLFWGENAGGDVTLQGGPITSPVHVVSSTQAFLLPFAGLEFGP